MSIIERALEKRRENQKQGGHRSEDATQQPGPAVEEKGRESLEAHPQPVGERAPASRQGPGMGPTVERPADVQIDYGWLRHQGIHVPGERRSSLEEEYRLIKRPLLDNAFGRYGTPLVDNGRLIMVTSAVPGEGKTFSTVNLALSMALEVDRTVLVVDADVARPSLPRALGVEADRGLLDVLTDPDLSLPDVLLRTDIPDLTLLGAGRPHGRSTELLGSQAMTDLLAELHARYPDRIILFDSPPLLSTSEPSVLARQMGQVLLVIEAESTAQTAVTRAAELLEGCDVVLTMLNKATGIGYGYGGYGYGGYGGYGGSSGESQPSAAKDPNRRVSEES